jgi:hypothetical protein
VNAAGADPAPGGSTAAVVALATGATASAVATATEAVIEALSGFTSTVSSATITVTQDTAGYCQPAYDGGAPTGFTFAVTTEGDAAVDIGYLEGELEIEKEENKTEIKAQQTGSNVLGHIRTGKSISLSFNLEETSTSQMKRLIRQAGGPMTPAGAGATEVTGWGMYKDFTQTFTQAKKLVLHPTALPSTDKSRDMTFWKTYIDLTSLKYSGENQFSIPIEAMVYPDTTKNARVQYYAFGDGTQTLT